MKKTKVLAFYLPQFHNVPENNEWWGEGYTEWTAVKKAEKYYENHNQPRVPLQGNYYDLLEENVLLWQADLAKKYSVDGFCFYHYYFKDGKKILEKPAEQLLSNHKINMPFCFCWANNSWVTTWGNVRSGNAWSEKFETKDRAKNAVLLEQEYGGEAEWIAHFQYLLPFFRDERYIKVDEKPVFVIYQPEQIHCLDRMVACWRKLACEHGMPGLYLIGNARSEAEYPCLDARYEHEPMSEMSLMLQRNLFERNEASVYEVDCSEIYERIMNKYYLKSREDFYPCAVVDFDNTPRNGRNGRVIKGCAPQMFQQQITDMLRLAQKRWNEFLFINAWNEWGEGMYLEPDEKWGYGYLEAIREAKKNAEIVADVAPKERVLCEHLKKELYFAQNNEKKFQEHYKLLDIWMHLREQGGSVIRFLEKYQYKTVAVYGIGILGKHLLWELRNEKVEDICIIDKTVKEYENIPVLSPEGEIPEVDVIIVTPVSEYEGIRNLLMEKSNAPIVSIKEVIMGS